MRELLARAEADRSIAGGKLEAAKLAVSRFEDEAMAARARLKEAEAAVSDLGLQLVSLAPPTMTYTIALVEDRGETCPLPGRTTSKDVLLAELLPRLAPADGSVPTPATMAEKVAVDGLPDQEIVVRNCTHTRVLGADAWAEVVILSPDSEVTAASLGHVDVVGP